MPSDTYGKTYMGVERSTFVIDANGYVTKVMRRVKPADHADKVLAALTDPVSMSSEKSE